MSGVITRALELSSDIERVWKALTDPSEIAKWFSDRAEFDPQRGWTAELGELEELLEGPL